MNITIKINTDNDAFQDNEVEWVEIARILREIADRASGAGLVSRKLIDFNGVTAGSLEVTP